MLCEDGFCTEEERNAQMQVKSDNKEKFAHKRDWSFQQTSLWVDGMVKTRNKWKIKLFSAENKILF